MLSLIVLLLILSSLSLIYKVANGAIGASVVNSAVNGMMFDHLIDISKAQVTQIYKKCFQGMGLLTCLPHDHPTDDYTLNHEMTYYKEQIITDLGKPYCVQCCGSFPSNIDHWNLDCRADATTTGLTNLYGYEFKFARRNTVLDTQLISCPLRRTACQYADNGDTLSCTGRATDKTYLHGYYLKIWVATISIEGNTWQSVYKCEAESYEENTALQIGDTFKEIFEIIHPPIEQPWDIIRVFVYLFCAYLFIYCTLYFCRRKHCAWCTKKLVFSKDLCWLCKLYGVEPPDPFILQALEEKALHVQGLPPERFPGSRVFVESCRKFYAKLPNIPNIPYIYKREEPIKPFEPESVVEVDAYVDMISSSNKGSSSNSSSSKSKKKQRQHQIKYPLEAIYAGVGHHDKSHVDTYKERVRKEIYRELGMVVETKKDDDDDESTMNSTINEKPKSP